MWPAGPASRPILPSNAAFDPSGSIARDTAGSPGSPRSGASKRERSCPHQLDIGVRSLDMVRGRRRLRKQADVGFVDEPAVSFLSGRFPENPMFDELVDQLIGGHVRRAGDASDLFDRNDRTLVQPFQ